MPKPSSSKSMSHPARYDGLLVGIAEMLDIARHASARAVNALMSATYWDIGRRIVEFEQKGQERATYGEELLQRLSADLTRRFGRGFSVQNLENMRLFYQAYAGKLKSQTVSGISATAISQALSVKSPPCISEASSRKFSLDTIAACFPLP
jgi:hypothetical protein